MPGSAFRQARQEVRLSEVLALLRYQPRQRAGAHLRGPCPVHGSKSATSRCFSAHLVKNLWHCFRCGAGGNALDLWAAVTKQGICEAVLDRYRRLGRQPPRKETSMPEP
jgi:DNA primase